MTPIRVYSFRSITLEGCKAKFMVAEYDNGTVYVQKTTLSKTFLPGLKMLRKGKDYYCYYERMSFRATTLHFIFKHLVDTIHETKIKEVL